MLAVFLSRLLEWEDLLQVTVSVKKLPEEALQRHEISRMEQLVSGELFTQSTTH
jgi:hypothetical protein